jgi:heme/copper-type cytochrome/quinol oxidase subunit 3
MIGAQSVRTVTAIIIEAVSMVAISRNKNDEENHTTSCAAARYEHMLDISLSQSCKAAA